MPLFAAAEQLDTGLHDWQQALEYILNTLASQTTGLPEALQPLIAELRQLPSDERNTIARQLLNKDLAARYIGMAPFIMAALQVRLGRLVLGADDVGGKFQVIGNRVAAGQLAQAGGAFKKQAADVRRQHAREGGVVQRLDLAGLQDAS